MKTEVIYRPYQCKDAGDLAQIILDTWSFDEGACSPKQASHIGYAYLYFCMLQADLTQVAEIDGHAVGIILGRTIGKRFRPWIALKSLYHGAAMTLHGTYRKIDALFNGYTENSDLLDQLSGVTDGRFGAEVALFIVSGQARGHGVGSALFTWLDQAFAEKGIEHYYLHTDTACSYEFYERKGLKRQAEVQTGISYAGVNNIKMFVYGK